MKYRLLLNILTTRSLALHGDTIKIRQKELDLEADCESAFNGLVKEGKFKKMSSRNFKPNDGWER